MVKEGKFLLNKETGEEIDIKQSDFEFVNKDKKIHDVKFSKKATTFFKDAMKRFAKSKSAVAGGVIVGVLILLALIVPSVMPNVGCYIVDRDSKAGAAAEKYMQPKLFPAGTGFWDGTIKKTGIIYNTDTGLPNGYREGTFFDLETYEVYENNYSNYGTGGYVNIACVDTRNVGSLYSSYHTFNFSEVSYNLSMELLNEDYSVYHTSPFKVYLQLEDDTSAKYQIFDGSSNPTSVNFSINDAILNYSELMEDDVSARIRIEVDSLNDSRERGSILVSSINLTSNSTDEDEINELAEISFDDANDMLNSSKTSINYWSTSSASTAYKILYTYCDFTFDQYESVYGAQEHVYGAAEVAALRVNGDINILMTEDSYEATSDKEELAKRFSITDDSILLEIISQNGEARYNPSSRRYEGYTLTVKMHGYALYGYDEMPMFLFGTNVSSVDYFKLIFTSLRFSFILAIGVSAVNILFGLCWGAISGYFGGWTDILMERFCEILSGLPSTVIITLCIMYGNEFGWGSASDVIALIIALFLTGWMGVAGRTRTQFYRFKGREYVLASRTLGAKDTRLIFRHILPNSLGTIITGSILMIPSVIYTEASIAYLGIGLSGQNMFGVILSEANIYYQGENTFLLIIPTIIMAALLVSFNLFGNGLRDAFNPSLKGGEQ